jgi:hypothetical protein
MKLKGGGEVSWWGTTSLGECGTNVSGCENRMGLGIYAEFAERTESTEKTRRNDTDD